MLQKAFAIEFTWVAFPLHPDIPEEGLALEDLFAGRSIDVRAVARRLKRVADDVGLPLGDRTRTFNTRLAQELAKWAEGQGEGDRFHQAVFRAYFVDGKNIGKVDDLSRIAASIGLSEDGARRVVEARTFRQAVDSDWARSRTLGISAVPTFVVGDERVVGAQPYDVLEQFVKNRGAVRRGV